MSLILNQAQAEAAYSAMCALNNVGSVSSEFNLPNGAWVQVRADGAVSIAPEARFANWERYVDQNAFATAYGLQHAGAADLAAELARPLTSAERALVDELVDDGPQSDVAAAAGGLTQTAIER